MTTSEWMKTAQLAGWTKPTQTPNRVSELPKRVNREHPEFYGQAKAQPLEKRFVIMEQMIAKSRGDK